MLVNKAFLRKLHSFCLTLNLNVKEKVGNRNLSYEDRYYNGVTIIVWRADRLGFYE